MVAEISKRDFETVLRAIRDLAASSKSKRVTLTARKILSRLDESEIARFRTYESEVASRVMYYLIRYLSRVYDRVDYGYVLDRDEIVTAVDNILQSLDEHYERFIKIGRSRGLKKLEQLIIIVDYETFRPRSGIDYLADARLLQRYVKLLTVTHVGEAQCTACGHLIRNEYAVVVAGNERAFYYHVECFLAPCVKMICRGDDCSINMETDKIRPVRTNVRRLYLQEQEQTCERRVRRLYLQELEAGS